METDVFVGQFLVVSDSVDTNLKSLSVEDSLSLSDETTRNLKVYGASNILPLRHVVRIGRDSSLTVTDALTLTQSSQPRVTVESVGHILVMSQFAANIPGGVEQTIVLSDHVDVTAAKAIEHELTFTQSAVCGDIVRNLSPYSVLDLGDSVSSYKPSRQFNTFPITIGDLQPVRFLLTGVVDETFRPPVFGNTDSLQFTRIDRKSRGGDPEVFRDNEWPSTETLSLSFDFTKQSDGTRMLEVLKSTIGLQLQYTDHEGTNWLGVITNPDAELVQAGRNSWQIDVVMEVDPVPTVNAVITDTLSLHQSATTVDTHAPIQTDTITLSQTVEMVKHSDRTVEDDLTMTQILALSADHDLSVSDELDVSEFASWLNVVDSLSLSDEADGSLVFTVSADSELSLSDEADRAVTFGLSASSDLVVRDRIPAFSGGLTQFVIDFLPLEQDTNSYLYAEASSELSLSQELHFSLALTVTDTLVLDDGFFKLAKPEQELHLTQDAHTQHTDIRTAPHVTDGTITVYLVNSNGWPSTGSFDALAGATYSGTPTVVWNAAGSSPDLHGGAVTFSGGTASFNSGSDEAGVGSYSYQFTMYATGNLGESNTGTLTIVVQDVPEGTSFSASAANSLTLHDEAYPGNFIQKIEAAPASDDSGNAESSVDVELTFPSDVKAGHLILLSIFVSVTFPEDGSGIPITPTTDIEVTDTRGSTWTLVNSAAGPGPLGGGDDPIDFSQETLYLYRGSPSSDGSDTVTVTFTGDMDPATTVQKGAMTLRKVVACEYQGLGDVDDSAGSYSASATSLDTDALDVTTDGGMLFMVFYTVSDQGDPAHDAYTPTSNKWTTRLARGGFEDDESTPKLMGIADYEDALTSESPITPGVSTDVDGIDANEFFVVAATFKNING